MYQQSTVAEPATAAPVSEAHNTQTTTPTASDALATISKLIGNVKVERNTRLRVVGGKIARDTFYSIGWGVGGLLQGDEMQYEELEALHAVMGRVLEQDRAHAPKLLETAPAEEPAGEELSVELYETTSCNANDTQTGYELYIDGDQAGNVLSRDFLTRLRLLIDEALSDGDASAEPCKNNRQ